MIKILLFLLLPFFSLAQPCQTVLVTNIIPNPSFETQQCCPNYFGAGSDEPVRCATGWFRGTAYATSDYLNPCFRWSGTVVNPIDGNSMLGGFIVQYPSYQSTGNWRYSEYIATCITNPFVAGNTYTIIIAMAAEPIADPGYSCNNRVNWWNSTLIHIFGSNICPNTQQPPPYHFPLQPSGLCCECPTHPTFAHLNQQWRVLSVANYTLSTNWKDVVFTFTPTVNINSIMIGGGCTNLPEPRDPCGTGSIPACNCFEYFYYDNIRVNQVVCNDNNLCTTDVCNNQGNCIYTPKNCNDNDLCTQDICSAGNCLHPSVICNDNNICTNNGCGATIGCIYTPVNCNDNNPCTVDQCVR